MTGSRIEVTVKMSPIQIFCFILLVSLFVLLLLLFLFFFTSDVIEYVKGWHHLLSSVTHTFVEYDQIIKLFVLITKLVEIFWLSFSFLYLFFFLFFLFIYLSFFKIPEHTLIFNSAPLMITFVGLEMQVGHIQIILSDHVSLKIRNTNIKLVFCATRPG